MFSSSSYIFQEAVTWNYTHCRHICKLCVYYNYYTLLSVLLSTALVSGAKGFSLDIMYMDFIDQLRTN